VTIADEPPDRGPAPSGARTDPGRFGSFLELLALSGVAVAQPVLDVFATGADAFVTLDAGPLEVVAFALLVALAPALVLWAAVGLAGLAGAAPRRWAHRIAVGALAAAVAVQVGKQATEVPGRMLLPLALVVGAVLVAVLARWTAARLFLRYLAVAPVVFVLLFLLASPVRAIVLPERAPGATGGGAAASAPVVMIVLDELPTGSLLDGEGGIDRGLYPNLAALADDATWYRNHTTVSPTTVHALPALLTGRWPTDRDQVPLASEHPDNLFSWLGGAYDLEVSEPITGLCPAALCEDRDAAGAALPPLLRRAVGVWVDLAWPRQEPAAVFYLPPIDPEADARFADFVASIGPAAPAEPPRLHFHHTVLPHQPWTRLPSGRRYDAPEDPDGLFLTATVSDEAADAARHRHLLQVQYTDRLVGEALDRLRALGRYDEALIVVTADHGVTLRRGERPRTLSDRNLPDILWTPLLVKAPGQVDGEVSDDPVRSIDVLPTMADHLGLEVPWAVDGESVAGGSSAPDGPRLVFRSVEEDLRGRDGLLVPFDDARGFAEVLRSRASDGDGPEDLRPYQRGDHGHLVGTPVDELGPDERAATVDGRIDDPGRFRDVDLTDEPLPAYVSGAVDADRTVTVVVAVNGVVGGSFTTDVEPEGTSPRRFWTMLPPTLLREGDNEIELFVARGAPEAPRLVPIGKTVP
jgi:hypothetical protein